jgi:hypothetical protein
MLEAPTVFVIGAGAGFDIGMPLGGTLSSEIAGKLDIWYADGFSRTSGNAEIDDALKRFAKLHHDQPNAANEYRAAGRTIKAGVQFSRSIDSYVNSHSHDQKIAVCAKLGILHTIIHYERGSALKRGTRESGFGDDRVQKSWLADFFHLLLDGIIVSKNLDRFFNNLTIINFNYDRCIEHFLFHALQDWSHCQEWEIVQLMEKQLKIFHPYGVVGLLPWQQTNSRAKVPFGGSEHGDRLETLVEGIKTFHEQIEEGAELYSMREALWKASNVIFLGFHFHKLLRITDEPQPKGLRVYATVMERSDADIQKIRRAIMEMLRRDAAGDFDRVGGDCKTLFREFQARWFA